MQDREKTKDQLIEELVILRRRVDELERSNLPRPSNHSIKTIHPLDQPYSQEWCNASIATLIQDLQQKELALKESENRLLLAVEGADLGMWDYHFSSGKITGSERCKVMLGLDPGANLSYSLFLKTLHPDDRKRVDQAIKQAIAQQTTCNIEYRVIQADREVRWIAAIGRAYYNEAQTPIQMAGITLDITQRKQIEEALRHSEERLRVALKSLPITIFNQDRDLRYSWLYNNPKVGHSGEEIVGKRDSDLLPPDVALQITQTKQRVINTGIGVRTEVKIPLQGQNSYFDMTLEPLYNESQDVIGITGAAVDISERKKTEIALQTNQILLNALLLGSPIGLAFLDRDLRYIHANEALADINGVPLNDHFNRTVWDVLPEFAAVLAPTLQQVMQSKQPIFNQEMTGVNVAGFLRHCLVSFYPICLPTGHVSGVGVTAMDVTELKRTEQALRESESRFKRLVESNLVGCIFWDVQGRITDANDAFLQMVGYTREDLQMGRLNWKDMTPPDQLHLSEAAIAQMKKTGAAAPIEKEYIGKDNRRVSVLLGGVLLEGVDDRGVSFAIDLTDRKQVELERERLLDAERRARSQAEEANRTKDEFLAVLSHELRTPLNPILGWAKLLRQRQFDPKTTDRALETIERNAQLQTQLIEDLLDVSRILRGKLSLNITSVDLATTIGAALETVRLSADAKGIQLYTSLDPTVNPTLGDANRLQQVVWNLVSNAVKFTPAGGRINVTLEQIDSKELDSGWVSQPTEQKLLTSPVHAYAQITVTDTGKGISTDFLPYVFDHFRQADAKITSNSQYGISTGVGWDLQL
ncbi:MAG: PAS domain-containing protein [Oculatellaceae cyanobacterium bins.114]|nr:PAS domain-containing protein [Oculatellaceae cyanobacterium bins.114]